MDLKEAIGRVKSFLKNGDITDAIKDEQALVFMISFCETTVAAKEAKGIPHKLKADSEAGELFIGGYNKYHDLWQAWLAKAGDVERIEILLRRFIPEYLIDLRGGGKWNGFNNLTERDNEVYNTIAKQLAAAIVAEIKGEG